MTTPEMKAKGLHARAVVCIALLLAGLGLLSLPASAAAPSEIKIIVLPFEINAGPDLASLRQALPGLISAKLADKGFTVVPLETAEALLRQHGVEFLDLNTARDLALLSGAAYALYGSLTQVGQGVSIDARLVEAHGLKAVKPVFVSRDALIALDSGLEDLTEQVRRDAFKKEQIVDIQVEGNKILEADVIYLRLKAQKGDIFDPRALNADLKRLYDLGYFEDVAFRLEDMPEGKRLVVSVKEKPVVRAIGVEGSSEIDSDDILAAMSTKSGSVVNLKVLSEDMGKIRELYRKKGYYNAKINYSIDSADQRSARLSILVEEGQKLYIRGVSIQGAKQLDESDVKKELALTERGLFSWFTGSGILKEELLDRDASAIEAYYANRGFIDAKAGQPDIAYKEDGIYVTYRIEEGLRYKVGKVSFRGDLLEPEDKLLTYSRMAEIGKEGGFFDRSVMREDIQLLADYYTDYGYAFAEAGPELDKHPESQTVNVTYNMTKNQKVFIRRVVIEGNTKTRDNVIRREMRLVDGDLFSGTRLKRSNERLTRLDYFESNDINVVPTGNPAELDLKVKVKEKATGMLSAGVGYSSFDQFFISGTLEERNIFGKGYYGAVKASIGGSRTAFEVSFTNPAVDDSLLSLGYDIYATRESYDTYLKDTVGNKIRFSYPLGEYTRLYWSYRLDRYDIFDVTTDAAQAVKDLKGVNWASVFSTNVTRDTTDRRINPTKGTVASLQLDYGGSILLGDDNYIKYLADYNLYQKMFWEFIFHFHSQAGYIMPNSDKKVPIYERFYLGGMSSVRGYSSRTISPRENGSKGDYIGGDKELFANFEVLFPLNTEIGLMGVTFFDIGNTWDDNKFDGEFYKSVGAGVRWYSPLGPLRLEYGYGLDNLYGQSRHKIEFTVGQFF